MTKPNLFIAGAMKCGTSIMSDYLALHPDVAVAAAKEVHYFSNNIDKGEDWYLQQFPQDTEAKYVVDASPSYFDTCNSDLIPKLMKAFAPGGKVIIMIRDPVDRLISHFNHFKSVNKLEILEGVDVSGFLDRNWLNAIACSDFESFCLGQLLGYSVYHRKLMYFSNVFGPFGTMVIHNADLRRNGQGVMNQVFDFLGLKRINSQFFAEQNHLGNTSKRSISFWQEMELYKLFGYDYLNSCRCHGVQRYRAPPGTGNANDPSGAIIDDVAVGDDGWLFLIGGSNNMLDFFIDGPDASAGLIDEWLVRVNQRIERLEREGIAYLHMFVPEKLSIYHHKLPWRIDRTHSPGYQFAARASGKVSDCNINLFDLFYDFRDQWPLYIKTDSHWNHTGAFLAYQAICTNVGVEFDASLLERPSSVGEVLFDLGSQIPGQPKEDCRFYSFVQNAKLVEEGGLVRFKKATGRLDDDGLHVGSYVRYENALAPSKKRVVLFGDSFSEYREHLLTGLLAETFAEFAFIWSTSLDYGFIRDYKPDLVINIMTERFMSRVPDDTFDLAGLVDNILRKEQENLGMPA